MLLQVIEVEKEQEFAEAFAIRENVFVKEQGIALEVEFDEHEKICRHVLVYYEGKAAATGRLRLDGGRAKLERICVLDEYRRFGLGGLVVGKLEEIAGQIGCRKLKLHGQVKAKGFYSNLGYRIASDIFWEEGIEHMLFLREV